MQTLVTTTRRHAAERPDDVAWTFHPDGEAESERLTWAALDRRARAFGALLQARGLGGARAILLFPPGLDFGVALLGCFYAGVVPVPAYPPEPHRLAHSLRRLEGIVADARTPVVLCSPDIRAFARDLFARTGPSALDRLVWLTPADADEAGADDWRPVEVSADALAFLQYTSGSTADPKGVMITHGSLMANLEMIREAYDIGPETVYACWLPLYHDMGLVGHLMASLFVGARAAFMPPGAFLAAPVRWLRLITAVGATYTAAPNFAFDLAVAKIGPRDRQGLDLSSLRVVVNGAGPVSPATLRRFVAAFGSHGLRRDALTPSYGMAELAVFATCGPRIARPICRDVDPHALAGHRVAAPGATGATTLAGSGRTWGSERIVIVDPETRRPLPADRVGEIWIAGPHVAAGYWGRPEQSEATFRARTADGDGPFLRTGDLGFFAGDELFVTGRLKDVVIIRGRNLYPHDIEATMSAVRAHRPEIRLGCAAATSVEVDGDERLVVLQEVDPARNPAFDAAATIEALREAITRAHGVRAASVVLLARGTLPKTSSGKIMRHACKRAWLADFARGGLEVIARHDLRLDRPAPASRPPAPAPADPAATLRDWLVDWVADALGFERQALALRVAREAPTFDALGLDSTAAVDLVADLEAHLGRAIDAETIYAHPDVDALAAHLTGGGPMSRAA